MTGIQHLALALFHFWTLSSGAPPPRKRLMPFPCGFLFPQGKNMLLQSLLSVSICLPCETDVSLSEVYPVKPSSV